MLTPLHKEPMTLKAFLFHGIFMHMVNMDQQGQVICIDNFLERSGYHYSYWLVIWPRRRAVWFETANNTY